MKTIVNNETNTSLYLLDDDVSVTMGEFSVTVGDPVEFIIGDLNSSNAILIEDIVEPTEWVATKYTHDGSAWAEVDGWKHPSIDTVDPDAEVYLVAED